MSNRPVKCILEIYLVDRVLMEFYNVVIPFSTFVCAFRSAVTLHFGYIISCRARCQKVKTF